MRRTAAPPWVAGSPRKANTACCASVWDIRLAVVGRVRRCVIPKGGNRFSDKITHNRQNLLVIA
jgi:hypothetical protein